MAYQELVQKAEQRKAQEKEQWEVKRAQLEREKLDTMAIIRRYDNTPRPFRDVTDSEYKAASSRLTQISTEISEGDYEANKPVNPLDYMTKAELQAALKELTDDVHQTEAQAEYKRETGYNFTIPRKDNRKLADIMAIQTRLQAMEDDN
ncbi:MULTISPECIES: hypothetical protein [Siminovitchia]|uniref:RecB family nuclease n=1 Tax=Siminovitchia thermophila TaxID=1245522 RepID=A0ABS2RBR2_9BACI|nr:MULTISPECIES: hypothetical protein [Siminovitchia]MBM7717098.1 putative RecB family nuclease [Siminovitchia thermophila]